MSASESQAGSLHSWAYRPRNPKAGRCCRCVDAHFEKLRGIWEDRYAARRPYVSDGIDRYLDCRDLHCGLAGVRCMDCGHELRLPFSCKRPRFCPSYHQKRVIEFGEWLCGHVLKHVAHRGSGVFSIPMRLRIHFMHGSCWTEGL